MYSLGNTEEVKKVGKFKDWETVVYSNGADKVCFAQSKPVLQSPKKVTTIIHKTLFQLSLENLIINSILNKKVLPGLLIIKLKKEL